MKAKDIKVVITDLVYKRIYTEIALHHPERGGALFGPKGLPFITHFEMDIDAETTAVSYIPSTRLINRVPNIEVEIGLQFKGIIHSHPRGVIQPSRGDADTVSSFFRLNPHFSAMALPIVQQVQDISDCFIYWYRAEKYAERNIPRPIFDRFMGAPSPVSIIKEDFFILPISEHVKIIIDKLADQNINLVMAEQVNFLKIKNSDMVGITSKSVHGHEFIYFVSIDYPVVSPVILYQINGETKLLKVGWVGLQNPLEAVVGVAKELLAEWLPLSSTNI